jgi:hypothetical protein
MAVEGDMRKGSGRQRYFGREGGPNEGGREDEGEAE